MINEQFSAEKHQYNLYRTKSGIIFSACQRGKRLYHYFDISWRLHDNFRRRQPITLKFDVHNQELTRTNLIVCETCITMATLNSQQNFFKKNSIHFN